MTTLQETIARRPIRQARPNTREGNRHEQKDQNVQFGRSGRNGDAAVILSLPGAGPADYPDCPIMMIVS